METISTGYRTLTPGCCCQCGSDSDWEVDGRGNVRCECQACPDCGILDAYGFHNADCPRLEGEHHEIQL